MIRIWDCYWNLLGSLPLPPVWPADCFVVDDAWRVQGARHVTLDVGGRRWLGVVRVSEGVTYAQYEDCEG